MIKIFLKMLIISATIIPAIMVPAILPALKSVTAIDNLNPPFNQSSLYRKVFPANLYKKRLLIESSANLNATIDMDKALLHDAAMHGHLPIVRLLIQSKANINAADDAQATPLHLASMKGHFSIAELLIQSGANVNAVDCNKNTPLHIAALNGHIAIAELLIESGANLNALNSMEHTPLYFAFYFNIQELKVLPSYSRRIVNKLIKMLSWYISQTCRDSLTFSIENRNDLLQLLNDSYESYQELRQINPFLSWLLVKTVHCQSKGQLIESILEYLNIADENKQNALMKHMDYLFLQKEILEEFNGNFKVFKAKFSLDLLEKLKSLARTRHAQNLKSKIFDAFDEKSMNQLVGLATLGIENNLEHIRMLRSLKDHLIEYCNQTQIQSAFVKKIIEMHQQSRGKKIREKMYHTKNELTDKVLNAALREDTENILTLIKDVQAHLDYIIQKEGLCLESPTVFGINTGLDILLGLNKNNDD